MDEVVTKLVGSSWSLEADENISFLPAGVLKTAPPSPADEQRHKFGLTGRRKDYFLFHALRLIRALGDVPGRLGEKHSSVELHRWTPVPFTSSASPFRIGNCGPSILFEPTSWPVPFEATLTYLDDTAGSLVIGERYENIPVPVANGRLYPEWSSWSGISFGLDDAWSSGTTYSFNFTPISFPAAAFVEALVGDGAVLEMLEKHGFMREFHATVSKEYAAALLFAGLAADTPVETQEPEPIWISCK